MTPPPNLRAPAVLAAAELGPRIPVAHLEAFYVAVLVLPMMMQTIQFGYSCDARRLLVTAICVNIGSIT